MDTVEALLRLLSPTERLEALPRTGWIVCGVTAPESVAAHSYQVALVAMWLADHLVSEGTDVDVGRVLRIALLHDVGEAMTTDLPAPVKEMVGRDVVGQAERHAVETVCADAPGPWADYPGEYSDAESLEARIVKASDRIQMLAKACQYASQHRGDVGRFFEPELDDYGIPFVGRVLERIRHHWRAGTWYAGDFD